MGHDHENVKGKGAEAEGDFKRKVLHRGVIQYLSAIQRLPGTSRVREQGLPWRE